MMKLTDRLQLMADQIEQNETMADIGTDHGFLPISLWEQGISPKVILTDVSAGSLEKARLNAQQLYPEEEFDLRLGSGLRILQPGEVDVVVIAGMGGILMTEILGEDTAKAKSFGKLILQPRSGQGRLRWWLIHNGWDIIHEGLVREGNYICEIITACPSGNNMALSQNIENRGSSDIEYEVPPWIFSAGELSAEFIAKKLAAEEKIMAGLLKSKNPAEEQKTFQEERIQYLKTLAGGV